MDVQSGIVQRFADRADAPEPFRRSVTAARTARIPVIFVRVAFRDGYPEVSPRNTSFSAISRRGGMTHSGIPTSGVGLSTLREAADRDYALVVLSDACLDADPEVHRVLLERVFLRQAEVMTVDAWAGSP